MRTPTEKMPVEPGARSLHVLVVDDIVEAADVVGAAVGRAGHRVRVAYCGPDAVAAAGEEQIDAAFVDIGLPAMDGYEVAGRMRALAGERPMYLIALTGHGEDRDRTQSRAAGFDEHLVKPIKVATLLASLERAITFLASQGSSDADSSDGPS